jgi:hypothetical protein
MFSKKHNPKKTPLLILILLIFNSSLLIATVRYVSHSGSNTPPYTSWATAADSIMSAINISVFGDTIYVANGTYEEKVVMIAGLSLIGAGTDSCIIDTRSFSAPQAVGVNSNCLLKNFKIIVQNTAQTTGQGIVIGSPNSIIEFNEIVNAKSGGVWCYNTNSIIRHNRIIYCDLCMRVDFNQPIIDSNYIYTVPIGDGIITDLNGSPKIRGNTIVGTGEYPQARGFLDYSGTSTPKNNLFYVNVTGSEAIESYLDTIYNNIICGNWAKGIDGAGSEIRNNNIENTEIGLRYDVGSGVPQPVYQYNNMWDNDENFQNLSPDTTNIFVDPMFVNKDNMDFHLQMYSPLIDAGDPNILDKDGSRSDIGLFGGPYGEKYTYRDLAPKPPSNLTAVYDSGLVLLRWNRNTEADFYHYRVYRDTVPNFMYDTTKIIAVLADTFYYDSVPEKFLAGDYYYKITALDSAGHQSAPSEEVHVNITGIPEAPPVVVEHYQLLNNYPNPFNSSTFIPYRLKEAGYVKLYVYDIKGELVSILINEYQSAGYYEARFSPTGDEREKGEFGEGWWTGYNDDIATGIYIYQIMVRGEGNIPVFSDMGKMILLK